jgi:hypothetical protein
MRKVLRLDIASVAWMSAVFYAVIGLFVSAKSALTGAETVYCPFGFHYPFLFFDFHLNLTLPNPPNATTPIFVIFAVFCYGVTGVFSGSVLAYLYNLTSRFWPGMLAELEPANPANAPASRVVADEAGPGTPPSVSEQHVEAKTGDNEL